jgi:hypothetical protein
MMLIMISQFRSAPTRWSTVRAGVNYHFNWGAAPVVANY